MKTMIEAIQDALNAAPSLGAAMDRIADIVGVRVTLIQNEAGDVIDYIPVKFDKCRACGRYVERVYDRRTSYFSPCDCGHNGSELK
jgi:DNA-binding XRE family transcriptional regulator